MSPAEKLAKQKPPRPHRPPGKGRKVVFECNLMVRRTKLGLTLRDVAEAAGLATASIFVIENGADPLLSSALKLARFYDVPIEQCWDFVTSEGQRA